MSFLTKLSSFTLLLTSLGLPVLASQSVPVNILAQAPLIDGKTADWAAIPAVRIPLTPLHKGSIVEARQVEVKAGHDGQHVYFLLRWPDSEASEIHKPWRWDENQQRYVQSSIYEDRLAMQFAISGTFTADWSRAGNFTADMWHWKASRSNPLGLAHDKLTQISRSPLPLANLIHGIDGKPVYVLRKNDAGTPLYATRRYRRQQDELMPKYQLNPATKGSIADIQAKGLWQDGYWTLEIKRKLNTGHDDDVRFVPGKKYAGAIAVYDASANDDHAVSDTLNFRFLPAP